MTLHDALGFKSEDKKKDPNKWRKRYYILRILLLFIGLAAAAAVGAVVGSQNAKQHADVRIDELERTITEIEIPEAYNDSLVQRLAEENLNQQFLIDGLQVTNELLRRELKDISAEYYRHLEVYHSEYREETE